jgi:Alw26I/Eco31I/Esp3I family type II restriction m6 adenine DNA methyltransferase
MPKTHDAQQLTLWSEAPHRNHYLFSDYYLNERLPSLPEWQNLQGLSTAIEKVKTIWISVRDTIDKTKEPQTREQLINPVLKVLGHVYESEPSLPTNHGVKAPDYAIFSDSASLKRAASKRGTSDYFKQSIAVAEAKRYGRSLDQKSREGADPFDNNNPSFQIDSYLKMTGLRWGLLTDGRYWRLYNIDTSFKLSSYYEVDLESLIEQNNENAFKYFYLFFRHEAFIGVERQESFLDRVFRESAHYAQAVSDKLKRAVYDALETLCDGFVKFEKNDLNSRLHLTAIYDNSLILLYRLLFIFYAESRGLLPLETNKSYRENYSLYHLRMDIAKRIDSDEEIPKDLPNYWSQLKNLFRSINEGSSSIGVYQYNGGLFDSSRHEFLESYDIGDFYLAKAIDLLARTENEQEKKREFVDYRDLAIQHLGSIYEGLLEHKPRVADEEMVIVREKGREKVIPRTELQNQRDYGEKHQGEIYLALEKGERKATGSYYTPDYIVKYIVENTLASLINERIEGWRKRVTDLEVKAKAARGENRGLLEKELEAARGSLANQIMSLRVLDPAMGSGHFLVRATERLAEELATNPDIPAPRHDEDIEDVGYWKRRVVERCIYGVDINPLAVELAKVSLWLATVAKNKPLSFLDHHLRCGNSLIGARLEDLEWLPLKKGRKAVAPGQFALFDKEAFAKDIGLSVGDLALIESLSSDRPEDIKEKDRLLRELIDIRRSRYKQLLDIWVSQYFGNRMGQATYNDLVILVQGKPLISPPKRTQNYLEKAKRLADEQRFFHWELEFPEVFFDRSGQRLLSYGFDAVLGNPPYDVIAEKEQGRDVEPEKGFYNDYRHLKPALGQKLNYYRLFSALSIWLTRESGSHGFIVPLVLIGDAQAEPLRRHMLTETQILSIEAFPQKDNPDDRVFYDAKLSTCVYVLRKQNPYEAFLLRIHPGKLILVSSPQINITKEDVELLDPNKLSIPSMPGITTEHIRLGIALSLRTSGHHFGEIASSQQGEVNLTTHSKLLSNLPEGPEVLRGAHVDRYEFNEEPKQGIPAYIRVKEFLKGKKKGSKFFDHVEKRIGYQRGAAIDNWRRIIACVIEPNSFCSDTINYIVRPKANFYFVLGLLNSSLYEWRFRLTSTNNHVNSYEINSLPLHPLRFSTPKTERRRLVEQGKKLYQGHLQKSEDWSKVLIFVSHRLPQKSDGTPDLEREQSDVVHDILAFLAEEMTRLHKEKQAEMKGFLAWLEGYVCVSVNDMKNKTKVKEYWRADVEWEGLLSALKQNQKAIQSTSGIDVTRREPQEEKIRPEFEASMAKLRPILECIETTDNLIDQIVYKLYGLTEQEIALVEKSLERAPQETEQVEVS